MHDEIVFAVLSLVCVGQAHLNASEIRVALTPQILIMISRPIDNFCSFARFTQYFLDNVIVCSWPLLTAFEAPPVNNVVDKIYFLCVVIL